MVLLRDNFPEIGFGLALESHLSDDFRLKVRPLKGWDELWIIQGAIGKSRFGTCILC